jgi:hypothetical protein
MIECRGAAVMVVMLQIDLLSHMCVCDASLILAPTPFLVLCLPLFLSKTEQCCNSLQVIEVLWEVLGVVGLPKFSSVQFFDLSS